METEKNIYHTIDGGNKNKIQLINSNIKAIKRNGLIKMKKKVEIKCM